MDTIPSRSSARAVGPSVAGSFYPSNPATLGSMVRRYLDQATAPEQPVPASRRIVAVVAPHAGYVYSGPIAGYAYAAVASSAPRTVVVMGPSHRVHRTYACAVLADVYRTPIGDVPIDTELTRKMLAQGGRLIREDADVFETEHSVDVQVPFIQVALPAAKIVPIVVPMMSDQALTSLAALLHTTLGANEQTLVVASSDLSHFYDYATATSIDAQIVRELSEGKLADLVREHDDRRGPCGLAPIAVALQYARRVQDEAAVVRLAVANSGDTQGDRSRVVGYAALALTVPK